MIKLLYVDLFCGAGGTTTGVEAARIGGEKCAKVIACVNHDANAIASHAANHPDAMHFTEDIRTLDIRAKTGASVVGIERNGEKSRNPGPTWIFAVGDIVAAIGEPAQLAAFRELMK